MTFTREVLTGALTLSGTDPVHGGSYTLTANHNLGSTSGGNVSVSGQADGNTAILLSGPVYVTASAPVNSWLEQNYGGLTPGAQYAFRVYYRQWQTSPARSINIVYNGEGANQLYSGNPLNEDAGGASYIEYDFTAATNYVLMGMTNLNANESAMVYGISIQQTAAAPVNTAPSISTQPVGFTNWVGLSGSLSVSASGTPAPSYQWYQNNTLLPGQTSLALSFNPLERHPPHGAVGAVFGPGAGLRPRALAAVDLVFHKVPYDLVQTEGLPHGKIILDAKMPAQRNRNFRRVPEIHRQAVHRLTVQGGEDAFARVHWSYPLPESSPAGKG
ncbi:MAG: immunoglobulin domain-containing protein [Verrucomicrobiota bacterium]